MSEHDNEIAALLEGCTAESRPVVDELRAFLREALPDAVEEPDPSSKLIAYTYSPGTYRGLVVAIAPHASHVNLMFSKGAELTEVDPTGLLKGTGKKARHIAFTDPTRVATDDVRALVHEAARRTPR